MTMKRMIIGNPKIKSIIEFTSSIFVNWPAIKAANREIIAMSVIAVSCASRVTEAINNFLLFTFVILET